ncbi:hypothetical protein Fuma_06184 [Fuerstiella marisgermanici]|uniref:Uncharacterized protein n=1 Tax=Fuerstiella marisgermanici TaxID=1891926 RepID=A0A1P8WR32_9PLAN|nr:hypothetical protein Fuma_06184 [Fuerstiella marisgermanici]
MRTTLVCFSLTLFASVVQAQSMKSNIPYGDAHERQVLDVYAPKGPKGLPVICGFMAEAELRTRNVS